ncbi:DUF4837 family protein [Aegicerativicinus sediminis]|uniref:DUF4837 family protein n=1 Tax=Aegicerativicinus sediminis TaxID=2893202 RepID=UPI001E51D1B2|nr:DUF4837 family protein [Aegicerativicinus sediminis]
MNRIFIVILAFLALMSCGKEKSKNGRLLSSSSGNINSLSVVVDNLLWENNVGEAIREVIAAPVEGLSIDEPLFSINQMPPQVFSDFTTKSRIILLIKKGESPNTVIRKDVYAKPQTLVLITGNTDGEIINQLKNNADKIVDAYKKEEVKEQQRRISLSLFDIEPIKNNLGISIKFPTAYRIAKQEEDFFWIRKDIRNGTMDLMLYELPLDRIHLNDSVVKDIIRMRDSIGHQHIEGPLEGSYMITDEGYAPYKFDGTLDGHLVVITKGLWDVKNAFMSGPFVNYLIEDREQKRYLVAEGYVYAPSVDKRDNMFELESIIKSIKFN